MKLLKKRKKNYFFSKILFLFFLILGRWWGIVLRRPAYNTPYFKILNKISLLVCKSENECYYLVSSLVFWIVDILGLAAPEWFFSSWVSTLLTKILVLFIFSIVIFVNTLSTHLHLEVNFIFQLVLELGTLWEDLFLECYYFDFFMLKCLKLLIMFLPLMVRTMTIGRYLCGSFWNLLTVGVVETGWTKPEDATCCANFNTRKRTNRLQYSVCASERSYPQGIALQKLISI